MENADQRIVETGKAKQPLRHAEYLLQGAVKGGDDLLCQRRIEAGAAHLNDAQRREIALFPLSGLRPELRQGRHQRDVRRPAFGD